MLNLGMIQNGKQAHRTLEKWMRQGKYECGVCLDLGWRLDSVLTGEGWKEVSGFVQLPFEPDWVKKTTGPA